MILVLTDPGVGGTFLTWSLHYLAGHTKYFYTRKQSWLPLIDNPVLKTNAHAFKPNQPLLVSDIVPMTQKLLEAGTDQWHVLYFHNLLDHLDFSKDLDQNTANAIAQILPNFDRIVLLTNTHPLYSAAYEGRTLSPKLGNHDLQNLSAAEQHEDFIEYFFHESKAEWQDLGLDQIWDQREFLALNLRPFRSVKIDANLDLAHPHFNLNSYDLYCCFDTTIDQLCQYLAIDIDQGRVAHWKNVYQKWRTIHYPRMIFSWYFNDIINYIINGYDMDLVRFNLDIVQEACIQHHLIYHHGLNFKTWQLEKFQNTRQLHQLLEPVLHKLIEY